LRVGALGGDAREDVVVARQILEQRLAADIDGGVRAQAQIAADELAALGGLRLVIDREVGRRTRRSV